MKKPLWRFVLSGLCALSLWPVGTAQAQPEPERLTVIEIQIVGNNRISLREILEALPFKEGDSVLVPDDLDRATLALKDLGVFQDVRIDWRHSPGGIVVILDVVENPIIQRIEIEGNRDWNEDRRLVIPFLGIDTRWPLVDYLVTGERMIEILKENGIETGKVLNTVKLRKALGIDASGGCSPSPPQPSICGEYASKGYLLFGIADVQVAETLKIKVMEGVIETIQIQGVEGSFEGEARKVLADVPLLRPVKREVLQGALLRLSQSVYFEPLRPEDVAFEPGTLPDRVKLRLALRERKLLEGPQEIKRIAFVGQRAFSEGELLQRVKLPEGPLDNYQLLSALEPVYRLYRAEGYSLAKFAKEDLSQGVLTLRVDEGRIAEIEIRQNGYPTARWTTTEFEKIPLEGAQPPPSTDTGQGSFIMEWLKQVTRLLGNILGTSGESGLPRTQPEIIAKELTIRPGGLINQYRLGDTYRKLLGLGYFKDVNFDFAPHGENLMKLIVDVTEQEKLGSLNGGLSLSPEGLIGQLSLSGKNLYGMGQDVSLQFDRGILGKAITNWRLEYQSRTLVPQADYFNMKLFNNTSRESSPRPHLLNRVGAEAQLAYPWEEVQLIFGLRHETFTKDFEAPPEVERGLTNAISLIINHDDRNNPIFATRGGIQSFKVEQAGLFALGTEFTKLQATIIQHFPTFEDQALAVRLMGGLGFDLPSQEEFALGGATTLRGIATTYTSSMAFMNLEYRIQIVPAAASIALFADVGTGSPFALKKSIGIEGRVSLPYIGQVRLAFAWPITDRIEYFKVEFGLGPLF